MKSLTPKQAEAVESIARFHAMNGHAPGVRELARRLGVSHATAMERVELLRDKGWLVPNVGRSFWSLTFPPGVSLAAALNATGRRPMKLTDLSWVRVERTDGVEQWALGRVIDDEFDGACAWATRAEDVWHWRASLGRGTDAQGMAASRENAKKAAVNGLHIVALAARRSEAVA